MRVNQTQTNSAQGAEVSNARKSGKAESTQGAKKGEARSADAAPPEGAKAEISSRAKDMARAREVADATPDVREEKIAELKKRIAEGRYNVKADAIADKLVDDHIKMSGIS